MINWQEIEKSIHNNDTPRERNKYENNRKQFQDNFYKENTK